MERGDAVRVLRGASTIKGGSFTSFGIIDIVDDIELDFCLLEHAGCLVGLQHCLVRLSVSGRRSHPWPRGTSSACSGKVFPSVSVGDLQWILGGRLQRSWPLE